MRIIIYMNRDAASCVSQVFNHNIHYIDFVELTLEINRAAKVGNDISNTSFSSLVYIHHA